jgi:hypothetical protein
MVVDHNTYVSIVEQYEWIVRVCCCENSDTHFDAVVAMS